MTGIIPHYELVNSLVIFSLRFTDTPAGRVGFKNCAIFSGSGRVGLRFFFFRVGSLNLDPRATLIIIVNGDGKCRP